ncbi:Uncharacterised protein [Mycobacteroides abscessus subsp. massiliense]|nr:Uncharacterised protein [Mycobacteroides abscessus subsp. massiliense]
MLPLLQTCRNFHVRAPCSQRLMAGAKAMTSMHSRMALAASSRVGGMLAISPDG